MDLRHQPPESESGALLIELQGYAKCSREDLHLEPPPSQSGVQGSYTSGAYEKWRLRSVSRRTLLVFNEALISLSYTAVVPPHGSAPRSIGYRPIALLLSYGGIEWSPDEVMLPGPPDVSRPLCS